MADWLESRTASSSLHPGLKLLQRRAPFGEEYAFTGSGLQDFTGSGPRRHTVLPGTPVSLDPRRFPSPDPAGIAAADPATRRVGTGNAYVGNRPLNHVDRWERTGATTVVGGVTGAAGEV